MCPYNNSSVFKLGINLKIELSASNECVSRIISMSRKKSLHQEGARKNKIDQIVYDQAELLHLPLPISEFTFQKSMSNFQFFVMIGQVIHTNPPVENNF